MKVNFVYWRDYERFDIGRQEIDISPSVYKSADKAYWKLLIADRTVEVKKNKTSIVKIKEIYLPSNTIVSPLSIMRHGLGVVLDVYDAQPKRVEEPKELVAAAFFPVDDGVIEKGDLIGVVKVFPVGIAPPEMVGRVKVPPITIEIKNYDVNIVYRKNGEIEREKTEVPEYWYRRWNVAEWLPLIADEDTYVRPGEARFLRIKRVEIPPETIPVPLSMMRHAFGTVIDVYHAGKPKKVEEQKTITHVLFMPVFEGEIRRGDVVGILNVYYISTGERIRSLMRFFTEAYRGNLVYWRRVGEMAREEIEISPFSFKRSAMGWFEPLVAAQDVDVRANEITTVSVEELEFPSGAIVQPMTGKNHALGVVLDTFSFSPIRKVEDDKRIDRAVFMPVKDGRIKKGDLLGVLVVYHVSVLREPEFFLAKYKELLQTT